MHLQVVVGRRNVDGPTPPGALEQRAALALEGLHPEFVMWEVAIDVPTIPYEAQFAGRINGDAEREDADQVCPATGAHGAEGYPFSHLLGHEVRVH
jgi:hypothetical protein